MRRASGTISRAAAFAVAWLSFASCNGNRPPAPTLGAVTRVSAATGVGAAPMVALSAIGHRAIAWVSAPDSGTDGSLFVSVDGGAPARITDPLAPVEVHGEAPPKVAFAPDGSLYAVYLLGKDVGKRFPVSALRSARSMDLGRTWSAPVTVTDDTAEFGSHSFHALTVAQDGTVYVAWLDGRTGKSAAYVTHSTDGGAHWAPNVKMSVGETCPCCRTSLAAGRNGVVYAAWRSVLDGNQRDVVVARSADYGATWTTPRRVHADGWKIDACPHAGPSIQLDSAGALHVLWWTGAPDAAGVFYAVSRDSARTFSTPIAVSAQRAPMPSHVQLALGRRGAVLAAWDELANGRPQVFVRVARGGSAFSDAVPLASPTTTAQFPVIAVHGDTAYVAWSATGTIPPAHHEMEGKKVPLEPVGATQVLMRSVVL
jgi:hypothetical protein